MIRLLILGLVFGLFVWNPYPLKLAELKTFDWLIMNTEPVQNENILIVDLDENFLEKYATILIEC